MITKEQMKIFQKILSNINASRNIRPLLDSLAQNSETKKIINKAIIWLGSITQVVKIYSKQKIEKLHPEILSAIIICLAEFLFDKNKVPAKVINDALKFINAQSRKNYANAVLRNISASISLIENGFEDDFSRNQLGCYKFDKDIFADSLKKPAKFLSQKYSLPDKLSEHLLQNFNLSRTVEIMKASNAVAPIFLRINTMKITPENIFNESKTGFGLEKTTQNNVFKVLNNASIVDSEFFKNGQLYIQDLTSVLSANISDLKLPENPKILDACAAPGGKISCVYENLQGKGSFTAVEIAESKIQLLEDNFQRLGHKIDIITADFNEFAKNYQNEKFDLILLDVPCSNLGVLARKPDIRWMLRVSDLESLDKLQYELLESASKVIKKQGYIIYSTCTILRAENQDKIKQFLAENLTFKLIRENFWFPQPNGHQGGYSALLFNA